MEWVNIQNIRLRRLWVPRKGSHLPAKNLTVGIQTQSIRRLVPKYLKKMLESRSFSSLSYWTRDSKHAFEAYVLPIGSRLIYSRSISLWKKVSICESISEQRCIIAHSNLACYNLLLSTYYFSTFFSVVKDKFVWSSIGTCFDCSQGINLRRTEALLFMVHIFYYLNKQ